MSWVLASFLLLGLALAIGFAWYERSHPSARVLALVATLAALAALGRIAFAPLPSVKPTTDIVLLTGYVLGGAPGFAVGAVGAVASNLFFGQGPWTPWQMAGWGGAGVLGALLARGAGRELGRVPLAVACGLASLLFGAVMNVHLWVTYSGDHTLAKLGYYFGTSLVFDVAHAAGSVAFCLAFGPALVRALRRYRTRFEVTWRPAPAAATVAAALLVLVVLAPPRADAAVPSAAVRYLEDAQNADGGLGPTPGAGSTQMHTAWAALGLAAAGRNPRDVERGGVSIVDYMRDHAASLRGDLGERTRTMLALRAAGLSPGRLGSRDLLAELLREQEADGSFAGRVNTTAFAILGLRAAGRPARDPVIRRAARFIAGQANADGGFNFNGRGAPSGADDTGSAMQGLAAAGKRGTRAMRRAARWLARRQNPDGGYSLQGGTSNAQSTAWAVQGLIAAGRKPARQRRGGARSPLAYLRSLVGPDGAVRYSRTSTQTPVWVTGQVLTALAGKAFPLAPAPRAKRPKAAVAPAPAATPATPVAPRAGDDPAPHAAGSGATGAGAGAAAAAEIRLGTLPAPAVTPLALVAGTLAAVPAAARSAGLAAAIAARTWLP